MKCWAPHKFGGWKGLTAAQLSKAAQASNNFERNSNEVFNLNKPITVRNINPNNMNDLELMKQQHRTPRP